MMLNVLNTFYRGKHPNLALTACKVPGCPYSPNKDKGQPAWGDIAAYICIFIHTFMNGGFNGVREDDARL
jgi:hypothetical protein